MYAVSDSTYNDQYFHRTRGKRQYELKNHLGNVLTTVTDRKLPHNPDIDSTTDYYTADIVTAADYYPFGMQMPGRHWEADSSDGYRFGFNGKEKDDELKGRGNSYNFGARINDPRVGRWLSVDPRLKAHETPYASMSNNPIMLIDPTGRDTVEVFNSGEKAGEIKEHVETEEGDDVFFIVDEEGNREKSESFEEGTLQDVREPLARAENDEGEMETERLTLFRLKGDEKSKELFEFFADEETIEWSLNRIGKEKSGSNILGL